MADDQRGPIRTRWSLNLLLDLGLALAPIVAGVILAVSVFVHLSAALRGAAFLVVALSSGRVFIRSLRLRSTQSRRSTDAAPGS
jgi:hypothetical protein